MVSNQAGAHGALLGEDVLRCAWQVLCVSGRPCRLLPEPGDSTVSHRPRECMGADRGILSRVAPGIAKPRCDGGDCRAEDRDYAIRRP